MLNQVTEVVCNLGVAAHLIYTRYYCFVVPRKNIGHKSVPWSKKVVHYCIMEINWIL